MRKQIQGTKKQINKGQNGALSHTDALDKQRGKYKTPRKSPRGQGYSSSEQAKVPHERKAGKCPPALGVKCSAPTKFPQMHPSASYANLPSAPKIANVM